MSRYYDIALTSAMATGSPVVRQWTSFPNGVNDPGALNVEFDFFSFFQNDNEGASTVTVHGIPLEDLKNASSFNGMYITVKAGMQAGLPLARPKQAGTILQGQVFQAYGNWQGREQTLDFVCNPSNYTYLYQQPGNIMLNWPANTSLEAALTTALNVAFPTTPNSVLIGSEYVNSYPVLHAVNTLPQLADFVLSITAAIKPPGVRIVPKSNLILATDGSKPVGSPINVDFVDLVGQPLWLPVGTNTPPTIQLTTVLRSDIQVGSIVMMPRGLASAPGQVTTPPSNVLVDLLKYQSIIQGPFLVTGVRQIGNFRDPNGMSWVTVSRCVPTVLA